MNISSFRDPLIDSGSLCGLKTVWCGSGIVLLALWFLISCQSAYAAPRVEKGVLDLANYNLEEEGIIKLDGEWEFYWKQLVLPSEFNDPSKAERTDYLEVPGYWNGYEYMGSELTGMGYATFRMTVRNAPTDAILAIDLPLLHTAYSLWINGRLVTRSGTVSSDPDKAVARFFSRSREFMNNADPMEIVIQVSNYAHARGGIWQTISLGTQDAVDEMVRNRIAFEMILFGAILIMALYYLGFFLLRRKEKSALAFSGYCFVLAFRIISHGSTRLTAWFPDISWELMVKLDYLTIPVAFIFICFFIYLLFPDEFHKGVLKILTVIGVLISIFIIATSGRIYTDYLIYMHVYIAGFFLYALFTIVLAAWRRRDGAGLMLTGCFVMFVAFLNDILYVFEVVHTSHLLGLGLFTFLFLQSFVLSKRFSKAFSTAEVLSVKLEQKVEERTSELENALNEISKISDERKELIHILCHDIANPIGAILGAADLNENRTITADRFRSFTQNSSQTVLDIISMIRSLMSLEKSDLQLDTDTFNLQAMVRESIDLLQQQFDRKGVKPVVDVDPGIDVKVEKTFFVNSVLNNLFTNAVKFSEAGDSIHITADKTDQGVELKVKDHGIGIPEDLLKDVFDISKRTTRQGTKGEAGTGFGMPLVKKLMEAFGGDIKIHSTPKTKDRSGDHGTEITLFLIKG